MPKKTSLLVVLLVIGIVIPSAAYALIYEAVMQNVTQTIRKTWYDASWQYRKSITIQGSQVPDPNTHSLDAAGGYMNIGSVNWGSVTGTISFWMRWDLVGNRPWGQHDNMETRFSGSYLWLDWGASDSLSSGTSFIVGKWYFIAIVWNENTNRLYLYVGDENSSPALDAQNSAWTSAVSTAGVTQNNFMASKGGINPTDGKGDDLRYWNIDRTLTQIQSDYKIELAGSETNLRSYFKLNNDFNDVGPNHNNGSGVGSFSFSSNVPSMATFLTNFPVLVSITDSDLANHARDDGWDILFTSSDKKTKMSHEIEKFDGVTGALVAWVKVSSLFTSNNTILYMYYGNPSSSSQQDATNVWDSTYKGVWHLNQAIGGSSAIRDSTSYNNHGTDYGALTLGATGKIGNAFNFDGINDYVSIPNSVSLQLTTSLTIEGWIKLDSFGSGSDADPILRKGEGSPNDYQLYVHDRLTALMIEESDGQGVTGITTLSSGTWYYVVGTWDGSNRIIYLNGLPDGTNSYSGSIVPDTRAIYIGGRSGADLSDGIIDEVRVSNVRRSADWIKTEYNNQNNPSTFYTISLEETH